MSKVYLEVGKRYIAKNGTVVGPMEKAITAGLMRCSSASLRQADTPNISQIWNLDGTVHRMEAGEEGHELVSELKIYSAGEQALSSANIRVFQLEGELSDIRNKLADAVSAKEAIKDSRDEAKIEAENWRTKYLNEKYGRSAQRVGGLVPLPRKPLPIFNFSVDPAEKAVILKHDVVRSLDHRIDASFNALNSLQSELESDRKSTNGRAIFFGSLGGAMVVIAAFAAHFLF